MSIFCENTISSSLSLFFVPLVLLLIIAIPGSAENLNPLDTRVTSSGLLYSLDSKDFPITYEIDMVPGTEPATQNQKRTLTDSLSFIPNSGLTNPMVQFFIRNRGDTWLFTNERIILVKNGKIEKTLSLDTIFSEMTGPTSVNAGELQPGKVNFFLGQSESSWKRNIPTYDSIIYKNIYPGIHLTFKENNGLITPGITLSEDVNGNHLKYTLNGISDLENFFQGKTVQKSVKNSDSPLHQPDYLSIQALSQISPKIKTNQSGASGNTPVPGIPYQRGNFSHLQYSSYFGGSSFEGDTSVCVDSEGYIYITGITSSLDIPVSSPAIESVYQGGSNDVFVTKLSPDGARLIYTTYIGGEDEDAEAGIAVDMKGNAYLTGYTWSTKFPTTAGAFQLKNAGNGRLPKNNGGDIFVSKISPTGDSLVYSTYLGGSLNDRGDAITVDERGNAYITGVSVSNDYPISNRAYQPMQHGSGDVIVTKLNPEGNALIYSTFIGGNQAETGYDVAVDTQGYAYVTGVSWYTQFPTTSGTFQTTYGGGNTDAFAIKVNPEGTGLIYSTYLGGSAQDIGYAIAIDETGAAYITGITDSPDYPVTPEAYQSRKKGMNYDGFITKINPYGDSLIYSTYLGGEDYDRFEAIVSDTNESVYVTGSTSSNDFPVTSDAFQKTNRGDSDIFFSSLDASGLLTYSTYLGGSGTDIGYDIAMNTSGSVYISGSSKSSDYLITKEAFQPSNKGDFDGVISVFGNVTPQGSDTLVDNQAMNRAEANETTENITQPPGASNSLEEMRTLLSGIAEMFQNVVSHF